MPKETQKQLIARRRKEVKERLTNFLVEFGHPMNADEIIGLVFEDAREEDDFESYVQLLIDNDASLCDEAQEITMELFNYFPRKSLGGKSFAEKLSFNELKKMEDAWGKFQNGDSGSYSVGLKGTNIPSPYYSEPRINLKVSPDKNDLYYDAMDAMSGGDSKTAIMLLNEALKLDPDYVQTHHGLSAIYRETKQMKKYREHTFKAFEGTKKIFPKWPRRMEWGDLENRQYIRAIFFMAGLYMEEGKLKDGIRLYRQLLKMCPNDNLGVRYYAAGFYAGLTTQEIDKMWTRCNGTKEWKKMGEMVEIQNRDNHFWKEPKQ